MRRGSQLHIKAVYNHPGCWTTLDMPDGQARLAQYQHQAQMICKVDANSPAEVLHHWSVVSVATQYQ